LSPFTPPTRTGYDFGGWFTADGTEYIPGTSVINTEGPLELFAKWSLKPIEMHFFNNHSATDTTGYAVGEAANAAFPGWFCSLPLYHHCCQYYRNCVLYEMSHY